MKHPEDDPPWGLTDVILLCFAVLLFIALTIYG
jgi:hypothetical protein